MEPFFGRGGGKGGGERGRRGRETGKEFSGEFFGVVLVEEVGGERFDDEIDRVVVSNR